MIIAIPVFKAGDVYRVSLHFGRAPLFALIDITERGCRIIEIAENPPGSQEHRRGHIIAGFLAEKGVNTVVTLGIGPGALEGLRTHGLKVYYLVGAQSEVTLDEALLMLTEGKLKEVTKAHEL